MKDLLITCKNQGEKTAAVSLLMGYGHKYNKHTTIGEMLEDSYDCGDLSDTDFPNVLLEWEGGSETNVYNITLTSNGYCTRSNAVELKFTEIVKITDFLSKDQRTVKFKISKDYDAVVTKENLQVGCQTIQWSDFDKLVEISKKVRG